MADPENDLPQDTPVITTEQLLKSLGVQATQRLRHHDGSPLTLIYMNGGPDIGDRIMELLKRKATVIDGLLEPNHEGDQP